MVFLLGGCALAPGINLNADDLQKRASAPEGQDSNAIDVEFVPITVELLQQQAFSQTRSPNIGKSAITLSDYQYRVDPQDVLSVIVWEHPELTIPAGEQRSAEQAGHTVMPDGTIFFPYVGKLAVAGLTTDEIRSKLTERLAKYIKNPQLDVRVVSFRSKRIYLTGEVNKPGNLAITDVPMQVVDAINKVGGMTQLADQSSVQLIRGEKTITVDLQAILEQGELRQNYLLQDGDLIHVPDENDKAVFVMGEVTKPGTVPLHKGRLSLARAISDSGGVNQTSADTGNIFVIRQNEQRPSVYHLNAERADKLLLATRFQLQPSDVVVVSATGLTRYNRVISQLVPTLNAIWTLDRLRSEY